MDICIYVLTVLNYIHIHGHHVLLFLVHHGYYKQLCLSNHQPHTTVDMSTVLRSTKACLCSTVHALNHAQYVVNEVRSCPDPSSLENWQITFAVGHLIPILVLICSLRTCPQTESIEKQLLTKRLAYTQSSDISKT